MTLFIRYILKKNEDELIYKSLIIFLKFIGKNDKEDFNEFIDELTNGETLFGYDFIKDRYDLLISLIVVYEYSIYKYLEDKNKIKVIDIIHEYKDVISIDEQYEEIIDEYGNKGAGIVDYDINSEEIEFVISAFINIFINEDILNQMKQKKENKLSMYLLFFIGIIIKDENYTIQEGVDEKFKIVIKNICSIEVEELKLTDILNFINTYKKDNYSNVTDSLNKLSKKLGSNIITFDEAYFEKINEYLL